MTEEEEGPYLDRLDLIMQAQRTLQQRIGHQFEEMTSAEIVAYIRDAAFWCTDELHEAVQECPGAKHWATAKPTVKRPAYLRELTDALCFLLNMYLAVGATPDELYEAYMAKYQVNMKRQDEGYDGGGKCDNCHRELRVNGSPVNMIIITYGHNFCSHDCEYEWKQEHRAEITPA